MFMIEESSIATIIARANATSPKILLCLAM
jgi:hypothetical protein